MFVAVVPYRGLTVKTVSCQVVLAWDEAGKAWNATAPALPGCYTLGSNRAKALERAQEAIAGHLEALRDVGGRVPLPPGQATVETVKIAVSQ